VSIRDCSAVAPVAAVVAVGGTLVGGTFVAVGGTFVAVAGTFVAVGGGLVGVAGIWVGVAGGVRVARIRGVRTARMRASGAASAAGAGTTATASMATTIAATVGKSRYRVRGAVRRIRAVDGLCVLGFGFGCGACKEKRTMILSLVAGQRVSYATRGVRRERRGARRRRTGRCSGAE
jgi:hypothetical protein